MDSNTQDGNHAEGAVAVDGYPAWVRPWAAEAFAKEFHKREIARRGEFTASGDERWPVCRIGMRGNTSMKDFNGALCDFYAHPGDRRGNRNTDQLGRKGPRLRMSVARQGYSLSMTSTSCTGSDQVEWRSAITSSMSPTSSR